MQFDDEEIGGKTLTPATKRYFGDPVLAELYLWRGQLLLGELKRRMQQADLPAAHVDLELPGPVAIRAISNQWGLADIDEIWIDTHAILKQGTEVNIIGYILSTASELYVELPDGAQTGMSARHSNGDFFSSGTYDDTYDGYPDGGVKLADFITDTDLSPITPEFQIVLVRDELVENYATEYPRPPDWETTFPFWPNPPLPPPTSSQNYVEIGSGSATEIYRRKDGHGYWLYNDYATHADGSVELLNASTDFTDTLFMMPSDEGSEFYYATDAVSLNTSFTANQTERLEIGENGLAYPVWFEHDDRTTTMVGAKFPIENEVPAGLHTIRLNFNQPFKVSVSFVLTVYTDTDVFTFNINSDTLVGHETAVAEIIIGPSTSIDDAVKIKV